MSFNGTSHNGGSKTRRTTANGMPGTHRPQAGRICRLLPASPGHRMSNKKRASNAFPPQSDPSLECLEKAHFFSSAKTSGLLRGVFFHPLVESTHIFKTKQKSKTKQNKKNSHFWKNLPCRANTYISTIQNP